MKCLICYRETDSNSEYHSKCSEQLFASQTPPIIDVELDHISDLAKRIVKSNASMTGVQKKLSAHIKKATDGSDRMTLVGLWGDYILKPPSRDYPSLPENENCTMNVSACLGIDTVSHGLIRLRSGELCYITRRLDRRDGVIIYHMEDGCQITETLTEYKYRSSTEKLGKAIGKLATNSVLAVINYFEMILVSFLTGNADMHLKNFSIIYRDSKDVRLAPAYDLVATRLLIPETVDSEELALLVNGKKRKLKPDDFIKCGKSMGLSDKQIHNTILRVSKNIPSALKLIQDSFLPEKEKQEFSHLLSNRAKRLIFNLQFLI